ncbi:MAG: YbhB/YbcL family Raf kinase inhibitor-like protein [Terrimesophilobacter sp.]
MANDPNWNLPEVPSFELSSPDFKNGDQLPLSTRGSGEGAGSRSPTLSWSGAPDATRSFALTMYDPDAPTGSGYWHWAVYNIASTVTALPADAGNPDVGLLPVGSITLPNDARKERYAGAAPPAGHGEHRYIFTVSALNVPSLDIPVGSTPAVLGFVMRNHIIGRAQLTGVTQTFVG